MRLDGLERNRRFLDSTFRLKRKKPQTTPGFTVEARLEPLRYAESDLRLLTQVTLLERQALQIC
jgi:hypothetical protein